MGDFRTPYQWRYKNSLSQRAIKLKRRSPNKFSKGHDITTSNHALLQGEFPQKNHTYKTFAACFIPPKQGSHLMTPVSVSSILPSSTELRMRNGIWFNFSFAALAFGDVGSLPNRRPNGTPETSLNKKYHSHRIHVWYIYLHLPTFTIQINQM